MANNKPTSKARPDGSELYKFRENCQPKHRSAHSTSETCVSSHKAKSMTGAIPLTPAAALHAPRLSGGGDDGAGAGARRGAGGQRSGDWHGGGVAQRGGRDEGVWGDGVQEV